jgi:hypothetical protein
MISASESTAIFNAGLGSIGSRGAPCRTARRTLSAYSALVAAKLRDIAPYAAIELVLPGGSVMALLLWLYRRQKRVSFIPTPRHKAAIERRHRSAAPHWLFGIACLPAVEER